MIVKNIGQLFVSQIKNNQFLFASKKKDLYQLLGVDKGASSNQIKKAYYKLAQELHPDKNKQSGAKDRFSQINNAYQVLSDQNKRKNYDQTGSTEENPFGGFSQEDIFRNAGFGFGGGPRGGNQNMGGFDSIFQDLFGQAFGQQGRRGGRHNPYQKQDLTVRMDIDFKEAVNGATKSIQYTRTNQCTTCKGSKAAPGSKPQKCNSCQGTGFMTMRQGMMVLRTQCQSCGGQGSKITSPCKPCSGSGAISVSTQQQVTIPRGIHDDAVLKFKGKGNMNGDLIIKIGVRRHPHFKRDGNDSLIQKQISVVDAVLGCELEITNIYDQKKKVKIPNGTQNGQKIKVMREGFYKVNSTQKGSMIVSVKIKLPKFLTEEQKSLYEQLRDLKPQTKAQSTK